jgi:hypothetical protein
MTIPAKYQSNHLFLLVGTNPLPNYVAALLLSQIDATVHLLYSDGSDGGPSTLRFAEFLDESLKMRRPDLTIRQYGIHEASEGEIRRKMRSIRNRESIDGRVGLNYTGGTKAMAIHAYRMLAEEFPDADFSYLDARRLAVFIDGVSTPYPVGQTLQVSFSELAALHGYEMNEIRAEPMYEPLFRALAETHSTEQGHQQWQEWYRSDLQKEELPDPATYPALVPVRQAMELLCDGPATSEKIAQAMGFNRLISCSKWFIGDWLEELALAAVIQVASFCNIHKYGIGLKPTPSGVLDFKQRKEFDLDVAALTGYQLFAISCIDSKNKGGETKKHLFEAYVRARQLGGDEARVALVCCVSTPEVLQQEIEREWHAEGQVRVFGRNHLTRLAEYFHDWFMRR